MTATPRQRCSKCGRHVVFRRDADGRLDAYESETRHGLPVAGGQVVEFHVRHRDLCAVYAVLAERKAEREKLRRNRGKR